MDKNLVSTPTHERCITSYAARTQYKPGVVHPPHIKVKDAIDIHCHAHEGQQDPYVNEWNDLLEAIQGDKPYNEVERGVKASLTSSMGRMAAHTGQEISFDDMLNCDQEFAPGVDKLTMDSPAPLVANSEGKYPIPAPGVTRKHEYETTT